MITNNRVILQAEITQLSHQLENAGMVPVPTPRSTPVKPAGHELEHDPPIRCTGPISYCVLNSSVTCTHQGYSPK